MLQFKYMNNKTTPRDFFLHIGATIALYASVIALMNLAFEIINRLLPDQLNNYLNANSIIYPISILVVLVPVLYLLEWLISHEILRVVEKKEVWVRKWMIYLTLFLTGATMVGDLVALINIYLNGEISGRFVWKVVIVLILSSAVFKYYFFSINENMYWSKIVKKIIPWWGIVLTLSAIIGGFLIVGSPAQQRALRFDEQRISDLTNIQWQIINYWQRKQVLPTTLSNLNDTLSNFVVPVDPETGKPYDYLVSEAVIVQNPSFKLCASFSKDSGVNTGNDQNDLWVHVAGRVCFDRNIDKALYPPIIISPTAQSSTK